MAATAKIFDNLALVGMETIWAGCEGLDAFERMIYAGAIAHDPLAAEMDRERGFPTAVNASLLEKAARGALRNAGIDADQPGNRIAVLSACWAPVQVDWSWASQVWDISTSAHALASALDQAQHLLASGNFDVVVFAAASGRRQIPTDIPHSQGTAPGFDRDTHGWRFGSGAAAVVLTKHSRALEQHWRVYALVRSMAMVPARQEDFSILPIAPVIEDVRGCCQSAREISGIPAAQIGYLEAFACGVDALDAIEIAGMVQAYRQPEQDLTTALGSAQLNSGFLDAAAGLVGMVRAALCLYHRTIPGASGWTAPKLPALWRGAPFYVPRESRAWFEKLAGPGRWAAINDIGLGGSFTHLLLCEVAQASPRPNRAIAQGGFFFFPIAGENMQELLQSLGALRQTLAFSTDLVGPAGECYETALENKDASFGLAIVGRTHDEVEREIELASGALTGALEKNVDWQTPLGSYFTPQPAGRLGDVAFVYPGAFNTYPGAGKDLFRLFPSLHQRVAHVTADMGKVLHEQLVYPRSLTAISKEEMAGYEARLLADPIAMLISGSALAILYTHILAEIFGIRASAAFGYSLGETSMMYATGVWGQGDSASARLAESDAFRMRLAGAQLAIRENWGLPASDGDGTQPLWSNYLVMAAPEKVQAALAKEPRVYLTHVNTPRQVVIGGDPEGCQRVVAELRCSSLKAPFDYALHCSPMRSEFDLLADLHRWPVETEPALRMYSAADYGPIAYDSAEIASKLAQMLTTPLDFPRLINKAYADGVRVFIEAGAGSNCARWISETLKGSPHVALSMDRRGSDDYSTIVRTAARLFCHRVAMDISTLFQSNVERMMI